MSVINCIAYNFLMLGFGASTMQMAVTGNPAAIGTGIVTCLMILGHLHGNAPGGR